MDLMKPPQLGRDKEIVDVSAEYSYLAREDEKAAHMLQEFGRFRHAMYFYLQAMEKYIRAKIFTLVNPNLEYYRNRNRNHSLEDAVAFLIEILTPDPVIGAQLKIQLNQEVLGDTRYQQLHNDLRYPFYNRRFNSYAIYEFCQDDCVSLESRLETLKAYLAQLGRL